MKVSTVLAIFIVLPMLASIGLYCYAFISTRWSRIDVEKTDPYSSNIGKHRAQSIIESAKDVKLELKTIRHAFRSRFGLFGYCLDYRWINLITFKQLPSNQYGQKQSSTTFCQKCNQSLLMCQETGCCMERCDNVPDCPSYIDEKNCNHRFGQTRYYWPEENCMWQSTWIGNQPMPRYLTSYEKSPKDFHRYVKRIRYYVMFLLFIAAPLLSFLALLIMFCISCVERFYSIPFAFVSFFSLASFISGAGALGMFLYEWVQERLHRPEYTYELGQSEAFIVALNPWLIHAEQLGLAFWITVAAIGTTLFTTIISCCFFCGLQSEKSKLRFRVDNDVYEIVQMTPYEE